MNQKYLKGEYSGGLCSNQSIAFEALPKNIAAFLARGRLSGSAKITTLDDKPFLTALSGIIDICPDQRFLREQLLPVLVPMQMAETPVPILKPIPHEVAEGYKCPLPDWNYLRWRGYTDEQYARLLQETSCGEWLKYAGEDGPQYIQLRVDAYADGNLAVDLFRRLENGKAEFVKCLTVNTAGHREKDCAYVGAHRCEAALRCFLSENGLMEQTGKVVSGDWGPTLWEYHFQPDKLKAMDSEGYERYLAFFEQGNRARKREAEKARLR